MAFSIELTLTNVVLLGGLFFAAKKLYKFFQQWKVDKMLEKWNDSPKDKVILHTFARCKTMPSISPFVVKLETYLRMAKIPYELDTKDPMGAKGKTPWISVGGTHIADSHFCIQFLNKKFGINVNTNQSAETLAVARACRVLLEDHFIWGIIQFRWVENSSSASQLMKVPASFALFVTMIRNKLKNRMVEVGIGLHTPTEIYQMTEDDLRTVSQILGNKKFLGGDVPCEDDCGVFGMVSQAIWAMPGSSFERLVNGELSNLKHYCERMKDLYWPDWENCIDKS